MRKHHSAQNAETSEHDSSSDSEQFDRFEQLTHRLFSVPKHEANREAEKEREKKSRKKRS